MDQKKIGRFLKALRSEKGLTQEQLAEHMGVTNRSISRWENGVTMPDFDLLIHMADYFEVGVEELLDGERKAKPVTDTSKEAMLKAADYSSSENIVFSKRLRWIFWADLAAFLAYMVMDILKLTGVSPFDAITDFLLGLILGTLVVGVLYTSRYMSRIQAFKLRLLNRGK